MFVKWVEGVLEWGKGGTPCPLRGTREASIEGLGLKIQLIGDEEKKG